MHSLQPYSESRWGRCEDGAGSEFVGVGADEVVEENGYLLYGDPLDADDPAVRCAFDDSEFAEILVERDENTPFSMGSLQDLRIAGVGAPVSCPFGIVTQLLKRCDCSSPHTRIEEDFCH